ncbi:hypothetical protein B0H12DRAFT_1205258 [Mycena haematopus]|nr:hypothetical protein B0H12DRAFT_1205258 [Mycena haematopus]
MSQLERRDHDILRGDFSSGLDNDDWEDEVLHGRTAAVISHAGEALPEDTDQADSDLLQDLREHSRYVRTELCLSDGDAYIASACVRRGWIPVSPWTPTVAITIRALEVYRVAHLRCPRLGIQAFTRALCDIHGVAPRQWLGSQFSVAFDAYLAIRALVDKRVQAALGRDAPNWRLKNACPCCLYKLEGEPCLKIPFMCTFDGNNSLSRYEKREKLEDEDGVHAPGASTERLDNRVAPGDYYLPREEVDKWAKDGVDDLMKSFAVDTEEGVEGAEDGIDTEEVDSGCAERWQNMKEDVTSRAYGMYDETGFFPALCRHGFVLKVVDMVKSGELSKYPLAIVYHILKTLDGIVDPGGVAGGYDIGCKLAKIVATHPALKDLARDKNFRALVGAFHGHGHNRLCALEYLMTYVDGVGLEPLEICESFFSKSNALASTTRYASRFHRQQAISTYLKHTDTFDTYQGLTLMLCNKYRRALDIKKTYGTLKESMRELGVESRDVFHTWLEKEKAHLRTLSKEPPEETLEMEYYQKLVNLQETEERVAAILGVERPFIDAQSDAGYAEAAKSTRRIETQRRHALELQEKALAAVHDLEARLEITVRWVPESEKWVAVAAMVGKRRYQRALDHLQGLIIARMFEMAKCNMSGTGYKLRKHIAKALQARSKAVKTAITTYNGIAESMTPPKPTLNWEEVVEYAFLADFDLLREGREDIRGEPWAQLAGRAAMDQHFKLLRADEEIVRLNVEIRRLVTFMKDEEAFLVVEEGSLRAEGKEGLAVQVGLLRMERARFTAVHMSRLVKLSREPGFTGSLLPGVSISRERHTSVARSRDADMRAPSPAPPLGEDPAPPADDDDADMFLSADATDIRRL